MPIDADALSSLRGESAVDMSLAMSLFELRNMSQACEALTEEGTAWLGYIRADFCLYFLSLA